MKNRDEKKLFPLFTDLTEQRVVVFGAGKIAQRRIVTLLGFAGEIVAVAPEHTETIRALADAGKLSYRCKRYEAEDLAGADLVIAATDCAAVNDEIYAECRKQGILVNVASDRNKCDFQFPGLIEYDGVVIGFNGGGRDHRKVREVREKTEQLLKGLEEL